MSENEISEIDIRRGGLLYLLDELVKNRRVAVVFCLASMISIQLGVSLSVGTLQQFGSFATTWMRLCFAAAVVLLIARPNFRHFSAQQWLCSFALGAAMALMTTCIFEAVLYAPLGLVISINFLGPICVAVMSAARIRMIVWPIISLIGVIMIAYNGTAWVATVQGVFLALGAAVGWGSYILLMKSVGARFKGLEGLSVSLLFAALILSPMGLSSAYALGNVDFYLQAAGLAVLVPLLPYILEIQALRVLPSYTFGLMMSLEPAIGALLGFLILSQALSMTQIAGVLLVVVSAIGSLKRSSVEAAVQGV
ncbi:EamA family transporter [Pseudomonas oryzihabitans]|uniref:EamA family transporter n=1 Tax=Pseudomonas oryzihabitans TaxID=47885 RepID=UPI00112251B7|nr:EamA family transporter [Pseudomonas psychrotolerans]QDD88446.1 hypothetical protein CCZ28_05270 [Pseudomonas psychrotolerans]